MSDALHQYLREKRIVIDSRLRAALQLSECPPRLAEAMGYSLLAPGKRLRPLLVLLAVDACGGREEDAYPAACAVEMIHTYSLIHDDLPAMDDDDLRRGLPTCHVKYGEALAILVEMPADAGLQVLAKVIRTGSSSLSRIACGRWWHGRWSLRTRLNEARGETERFRWLRLKTFTPQDGALFRACLRMGAWAASAPANQDPEPAQVASLDAYGRCFGQAFQVTDDLLDVQGEAEQTGKQVRKDAARGKLTYPGLLGVSESRAVAARLCNEAVEQVSCFGSRPERLEQLAVYILNRNQ